MSKTLLSLGALSLMATAPTAWSAVPQHPATPPPPHASSPPPRGQTARIGPVRPLARTQVGVASYYGGNAREKTTASGTKMDPGKMTAASRTLPLGAKAKVTNSKTGAAAVVTITDRGPYAKNRILDVSPKAADRLGMKTAGVAAVKVTPLELPKGPTSPAGAPKSSPKPNR